MHQWSIAVGSVVASVVVFVDSDVVSDDGSNYEMLIWTQLCENMS